MAKEVDAQTEVDRVRRLNLKADGNLDRVGTITQELTPSKLSQIFSESSNPGDMFRLFELYEKIEAYDGKIKGLIEKRRKSPTRFPYQVRNNYPDHERSTEVQEFVEDVINKMDIKKLMRRTVDGILHGVKLMEMVWTRNADGYIVCRDPIEISSSRYGQENQQYGQVAEKYWGELYIKTGEGLDEKTYVKNIDEHKIFKAIYRDKKGFYDLAGIMRPLLKWYLFKYFAFQYWIEFDETYGFPTTVCTIPKNDYYEFKNEIEEFLQNVGRNKFGILLEGMEYEVHSQQAGGQVDFFKELIKYVNKEIAFTVLGQNLSESDSTQGSYAESVVGYDMETDLIIDDSEFVDQCINENIIKPLIAFNFEDVPEDIVEFYTNTPERKDWQKITKKWELAAKLGLEGVSKKQLAEELEIEFADDEEDSVDLYWQPKPEEESGGEHPPAEERERDDEGGVANND